MGPTAVDSCFDVAFWFLDRALDEGEYLQPQKMHRLIFLSQGYFAALEHGQKLMPATFVVTVDGPIEPTLFRAMERGRPLMDTVPLEARVEEILDSVWRQFGAKSVERLNKAIAKHPPVANAMANGERSEIPFDAIVSFYGKTLGQLDQQDNEAVDFVEAPAPAKVSRPKMMRSHTGKPVNVNRWMPRRVD